MNGTINGTMNGTVRQTQLIAASLGNRVRWVLLGLTALTFAIFFYDVASWVIFEIRTRALLATINRMAPPAPLDNPPAENRLQNLSAPDPTGNPSDPEQAKRKEMLARLEQRALFGEPKPTLQRPRVEAILGDAALINGLWLSRGGKTDDYTLADIGVDTVTMDDREGRRQDYGLASAENTSGPTASDSAAKKTTTETERPFNVPDAILDAIKRFAPDATLKKLKWDGARGHYAVETVTNDGRDIDMKITAGGSLRVKDEEVRLADLPAGVHSVVQGKLAGGGTLSDLKRWTRDGEVSYEAEIKTGSQKVSLEMKADGTPLDKN